MILLLTVLIFHSPFVCCSFTTKVDLTLAYCVCFVGAENKTTQVDWVEFFHRICAADEVNWMDTLLECMRLSFAQWLHCMHASSHWVIEFSVLLFFFAEFRSVFRYYTEQFTNILRRAILHNKKNMEKAKLDDSHINWNRKWRGKSKSRKKETYSITKINWFTFSIVSRTSCVFDKPENTESWIVHCQSWLD